MFVRLRIPCRAAEDDGQVRKRSSVPSAGVFHVPPVYQFFTFFPAYFPVFSADALIFSFLRVFFMYLLKRFVCKK